VRAPAPPHEAVAEALAALNAAGTRWCMLRGAGELHRRDGEVDLLVDRRALRALPKTLAAAGNFAPVRAWGRGPQRVFVADDAPLRLGVVGELHFGRHQELPTRTAAAVLARRVRDGALWLPAPADAFWALLLHVVLDRDRVRAREIVALAPAARGASSPLADVVTRACPAAWDAARVLETAAAGRFEELAAIVPALRARWPGSSRVAIAARVALGAAAGRVGAQHNGLMTSNSRPRSAG
jgi:hypothetical protein